MTSVSVRWTGFDGVTSWLFEARRIAALDPSGPRDAMRKTLGAAGRMVRLKLSLTPPGVLSTSVVLPSKFGNWALIWVGETKSTGTPRPLTCRQLSARDVVMFPPTVPWLIGLRLFPKTVINPPG